MHSDPIADMFTRIRNGGKAKMPCVRMPWSRMKVELAKVFQAEGLINSYEVVQEGKFEFLRIHLKYDSEGKHTISRIKRVSKPGLRIYKQSKKITPMRSGLALQVISTSQGILTDRDARRRRIGGEVLCEVW